VKKPFTELAISRCPITSALAATHSDLDAAPPAAKLLWRQGLVSGPSLPDGRGTASQRRGRRGPRKQPRRSNPGLACGRVAGDKLQGVLIVPSEIDSRDLAQSVAAGLTTPLRGGVDFYQ
jgi:hypothetical protein